MGMPDTLMLSKTAGRSRIRNEESISGRQATAANTPLYCSVERLQSQTNYWIGLFGLDGYESWDMWQHCGVPLGRASHCA